MISQRMFEVEKDQVNATQNSFYTVHALARRQNHVIRSTCLQGLFEVVFLDEDSPNVFLNEMEYYQTRKVVFDYI